MPNWTYNYIQFVGKTEESVKQLKDLLKSDDNGKNNWYDWSIMNWGTKWNAQEVDVRQNKNVLDYSFQTAWDAPREIIQALEHMKDTILKDISIDWSCVHEDGDEEETLLVANDE